MIRSLNSLPTPPPLAQGVNIEVECDINLSLECLALAIHDVRRSPSLPETRCICAAVVQDEPGGIAVYYLVPIQYVVNVSLASVQPGLRFSPPKRLFIITPDRPAPAKGMGERRLVAKLSKFGVPPAQLRP